LGHVAIDGTKLEANASRHKSVSYGKLTEQEQYWQQQVDEMLRRASAVDEEEGRGGQRTAALPAELAGAQSRLKRLQEAKRELEQEAQQQLEEAKRAWSSRGKRGRPRKGDEPQLHTKECHKERKRYYRALPLAGTESHRRGFTPDARQRARLYRAGLQCATRGGFENPGDCSG
jgi:hypothetical protein